MTKILFTGDSITDGGRTTALRAFENMPHMPNSNPEMRQRFMDRTLGEGYPCLINARLACDHPGEYTVLNRGISGHRISDIYARIKRDLINLKPDVLSMMIGINDVWHECNFGNGIDNKRFEQLYDITLDEVKEALPELKIILLEPYVYQGFSTNQHWDYFRDETLLRREVVRKMAEKYGTYLLTPQDIIDKAMADTNTESTVWTADGVHLTPAGNQLIADAWLKFYNTIA